MPTRRRSKAEREFVSEAEEILDAMAGALSELGERVAAGEEPDPDGVHGLFRSAHSLKALAGLFRFQPIEGLAHALEDMLDRLRLGRVASDPSLLALVEEAVELFVALLERVGDAEAIGASGPRIGDLAARLGAAAEAGPGAAAADEDLELDPAVRGALTEYEEHRLRESLRRGRSVYAVEVGFPLDAFEAGLSALSEQLKRDGELISTLPSAAEGEDAGLHFSLLVASDETLDALRARLGRPEARLRPLGGGPAAASPRQPHAEVAERPEPGERSLQSISETVRVDIRKLDELMHLVGELVIQRGAIGELIDRLGEAKETARIGADFAKLHKAFDRRLRELQNAVIDARMVPLRQVFDRISREVRRLRRELGVEVELEIRGADTELDKLIVEGLVDPLMHLVRNALDHGIEPPEERTAAGKPARGILCIEALQRGNHVVVELRDDGRGIDRAQLRARAERRGLVGAGEVLSDRETLDLVFSPGFSTRETVTGTSGRGVGMDVVRANLLALGGMVEIDSAPGRGTRISMTLPITLAILQSLVVVAGGQRFAIPLSAVHETLWFDPESIQRSEDRAFIDLRGEPLPLRRLADELRLEAESPGTWATVIVLGMGEQRLGLLVDRLEGQQDTVIKPIQGPLAQIRGIAGGTDLGDRQPLLVLDVSALIEDAARNREAA